MPSPTDGNDADTRPSPTPASPPRTGRTRIPTFGLSATQLIATGLAAITATVAASFLGVAGTVVGAALASMTTAAGTAVYGQSLRRGRERVVGAVPVLARPMPPAGTADIEPVLPAAPVLPAVIWKRVAIGAVSVFVVVLAVVTGVEVVAGRPIADVVRGDSGSGTSFFGTATVRTKTVIPPAPTTTVTVTPKVVVTTPTVTETAPATTRTATPRTPTATSGGSGTPSSSSSAGPTDTPSASASGTRSAG